MRNLFVSIITCLCFITGYAQPITTSGANGTTPEVFLNTNFAGEGVELHNCKFNWSSGVINGSQVGTFTNTNPNFPFTSGILLTTGNISVAQGPNNSGGESSTTGVNIAAIDQDLQQLVSSGYTANNASVLEFNFYSSRNEYNNVVSFHYIFGSEEYPEYVCSDYNDVFGFFLYGPNPFNCGQNTNVNNNIAIIPGAFDEQGNSTPVAINTLNSGQPGGSYPASGCASLSNSNFYYNNNNGQVVEYDGYTAYWNTDSGRYIGMTAESTLCPCAEYKMKISIANVSDNAFDSGVFLEQGSFKLPQAITITDSITANRDTIIKNCTESNLQIKYGEPLETSMNIVLFSDGGTAEQEDFYVLRLRPNNLIDTLNHGDTIFFPEGDTLINIVLKATEEAEFEPGEVKTIRLIFKSILCSAFRYLDGHVEERAQWDTLNYVMIDNNRFTLVSEESNSDSLFFCDKCTHIETPIIGGTEPLVYKWTPSDVLETPNARESDCNLTQNTTFQIIVSDRWGCLVDTCYHTALITSTPVLEGHYRITPTVICVPEEVEFKSTATPASTHEWIIFNDNMRDTIYGANQHYTFTEPGKYSITYRAYEAEACDTSLTLINYINAGLQPTALFHFDPAEAEVGQEVVFTNESEGLNVHYQWSFGDGSNSSEVNPTHVYNSENSENYTVILTVSDDANCQDMYTSSVPVVDNHVLFVPNSFTPNQDGLNDVFQPVVACVARYYIMIYDRNGSLVFASDNPELGWNGKTSTGVDCPSGTYTYYINYVRYNNLKQELLKTGSIYLLR
jgi:gliding motility-associated-like protein